MEMKKIHSTLQGPGKKLVEVDIYEDGTVTVFGATSVITHSAPRMYIKAFMFKHILNGLPDLPDEETTGESAATDPTLLQSSKPDTTH
jgi:hypothetical protein